MQGKPVSSIPSWLLPWLPSVWTFKPNKPFPPQVPFDQCFIRTTECKLGQSSILQVRFFKKIKGQGFFVVVFLFSTSQGITGLIV